MEKANVVSLEEYKKNKQETQRLVALSQTNPYLFMWEFFVVSLKVSFAMLRLHYVVKRKTEGE